MKTKTFLYTIVFLLIPPFIIVAHGSDSAKPWQVRDGIANSILLFEKGDYQQVAFFGGMVLQDGKAYYDEVGKYLKEKFPGSNIGPKKFPDQYGSWYGAFRVARGEPVFGATVHSACLAMVDFAPDDVAMKFGEKEITDQWEGIARGFRSFRSTLDVVFIYTLNPEMLDDYKAGKTPLVIRWAERVADHYKIPSVNLAKYAADQIIAGKLSEKEFFAGGSFVPTPAGAKLYADCFKEFFDACLKARSADGKTVGYKMPPPLSPTNMEKAQIIAYDWGQYSKSWKDGQPSPNPYFRHLLVTEPSKAEYTLTFKGKRIGVLSLADSVEGAVAIPIVEYSLDGSEWKTFAEYSSGIASPYVLLSKIAGGLDPEKEHILKLRALSRVKIGAFLVDGTVKSPYDGMSPLERADAAYASIPPIDYTPPKNRWTKIPKTMEKLKNGPTLKIVMLGDSIMGDTGSSQYDKLLERAYPNCKVEKIMSLRGSTGCWWYKDENRVEDYVSKHKPDLLMIGGISQRGDTEAIRSVIHQVRAKQNPEIMLITPVFGSPNDPHIKNWTDEIDGGKYAYRADLKKLAEEENCEFVDLTGEFWKYIQNSGKCYGWFMRDAVHANDRGFQVIGRPLVRYLTEP